MKKVTAILLILLIGASLFIWFGVYNIAATDKHWAITNTLLGVLRERSIEVRAEDIVVPNNLEEATRISQGASNYEEMCSICHLAPGIDTTETHDGLYPQPPVFYRSAHGTHDVKDNFWVIKNGIKLTGMPAWGGSHSDEEIWALVAFISQMSEISAKEYQSMTAGGAGHGDSSTGEKDHPDSKN